MAKICETMQEFLSSTRRKPMADDQHDIEKRVMATIERTYHCLYCHSVWREGLNGRCKSCGSGEKVCNSCHNTNMRTHTHSSGPK